MLYAYHAPESLASSHEIAKSCKIIKKNSPTHLVSAVFFIFCHKMVENEELTDFSSCFVQISWVFAKVSKKNVVCLWRKTKM